MQKKWEVLRSIGKHNTVNELAEGLKLKQPNVSKIVSDLHRDGLVKKTSVPARRGRMNFLERTPKGERLIRLIEEIERIL